MHFSSTFAVMASLCGLIVASSFQGPDTECLDRAIGHCNNKFEQACNPNDDSKDSEIWKCMCFGKDSEAWRECHYSFIYTECPDEESKKAMAKTLEFRCGVEICETQVTEKCGHYLDKNCPGDVPDDEFDPCPCKEPHYFPCSVKVVQKNCPEHLAKHEADWKKHCANASIEVAF